METEPVFIADTRRSIAKRGPRPIAARGVVDPTGHVMGHVMDGWIGVSAVGGVTPGGVGSEAGALLDGAGMRQACCQTQWSCQPAGTQTAAPLARQVAAAGTQTTTGDRVLTRAMDSASIPRLATASIAAPPDGRWQKRYAAAAAATQPLIAPPPPPLPPPPRMEFVTPMLSAAVSQGLFPKPTGECGAVASGGSFLPYGGQYADPYGLGPTPADACGTPAAIVGLDAPPPADGFHQDFMNMESQTCCDLDQVFMDMGPPQSLMDMQSQTSDFGRFINMESQTSMLNDGMNVDSQTSDFDKVFANMESQTSDFERVFMNMESQTSDFGRRSANRESQTPSSLRGPPCFASPAGYMSGGGGHFHMDTQTSAGLQAPAETQTAMEDIFAELLNMQTQTSDDYLLSSDIAPSFNN